MASAVSPISFSTCSSPPISACISRSTRVPCCRPNSTSFWISANSTDDVSRSSCSSCASVLASRLSWYFLRRSASSARARSPRASISRAMAVSLSVSTVIRRWYWCSLSRCVLRSRIALARLVGAVSRGREGGGGLLAAGVAY